jgi:ADP-heptose:LPS heptosyltransferase
VLDCDPRLNPLFARSFPEIEVVSGFEPSRAQELSAHKLRAPSFPLFSAERVGNHEPTHSSSDPEEAEIATHLPTGSLPGLFRASEAAYAATTSPYLKADPAEAERFRAQYSDGRRLIGLAWQTRNKQTGRKRSLDLAQLAPLFAQPGIRWISLQYGDFDALEEQAAAAGAPLLIDRAVDQFANIDLFAAQIAAMDQVITIDNSTAHLAAALGLPVWLLLPFAADWRWLQSREFSPWYPTMRLFRQPQLGDWAAVIESVQSALG